MKKLALLGCSSMVALTFIGAPAIAQDEGAEADDQIIVTGIRRSLSNSADIKRSEAGVVDAIISGGNW